MGGRRHPSAVGDRAQRRITGLSGDRRRKLVARVGKLDGALLVNHRVRAVVANPGGVGRLRYFEVLGPRRIDPPLSVPLPRFVAAGAVGAEGVELRIARQLDDQPVRHRERPGDHPPSAGSHSAAIRRAGPGAWATAVQLQNSPCAPPAHPCNRRCPRPPAAAKRSSGNAGNARASGSECRSYACGRSYVRARSNRQAPPEVCPPGG